MRTIQRGTLHRLTARAVEAARTPGARLPDGGGLVLQVTKRKDGHGVTKSWLFIYEALAPHADGRRRRPEMGLGGYPLVSLAEARQAAAEARAIRRDGRDPRIERDARLEAARIATASTIMFHDAWTRYIEANRGGWTSLVHAEQWRQTLADYADPHIGRMAVADITAADIVRVLRDIWERTPTVADRLLNRCELVLTWATARGYRKGDNPANRELLKHLLPARAKRQVVHHAALAPAEVPGLGAELRVLGTVEAQALEFLILTATRTAEVLQAPWAEFDVAARLWVVPAGRMKAKVEHRIPLSGRVCTLLAERRAVADGGFVFHRSGKPLHRNALLDLMRRNLKIAGATPHGLRSAFADWATEVVKVDPDVREWALAHKVGNAVSRAYARGDRLEARAELMERWSQYVEQRPAPDNVRELPKRRA